MYQRRLTRSERGQGLAEFALIFPIFLLAVVAVFDFGRAVYGYSTISNAARAGARAAAVTQDNGTIIDRTRSQLFGLPDASIPPPVVVESGCQTVKKIGCTMRVSVTYDYQALTPIIGRIVGPIHLVAMAEIPIERVSTTP